MHTLRKLLPKKLFWRYMLIFVFVGVFPFVAITGISLEHVSKALRNEAQSRITQMIHLSGVNLDSHFQSLESITERMYLYRVSENGTYKTLEGVLKSKGNVASNMNNYLSSLADSSKYLRNVLFVDLVNQATYAIGKPSVKSLRLDWHFDAWDLIRDAALHPREMTISDLHRDSYFNYNNQTVFTFCRPMLSLDDLPEKETILGYLLLDIDRSIFDDAFRAYDWQDAGTLYVLSRDNQVLYASSADAIGTAFDPALGQTATSISESIPTCNWKILFLLDENLAMAPVCQLRDRLFALAAAVLAAMLMITWLSSRRMSMPIRKILDQMDQVRSGNLDVSVPVYGTDELSGLSSGFNHMTKALRKHIEQSYVASIRQKEAELDALRMQIHPHFLYNTLEVIRMSSVAHQDMETAQMTLSLVHQLQYVIGESKERVPLGKELEIVRDYISLVSLRYGQINLTTDIPAALSGCLILKMTLQPIVENAVQHGLRPLGGGQISISAVREGDTLRLTVMDNGCGMSAEQLKMLRAQLESDHLPAMKEDGLRSIGTKNVHDRIRLACGHPYGLEIESQEDVGTAVVIRLPYHQPEGRNETVDC